MSSPLVKTLSDSIPDDLMVAEPPVSPTATFLGYGWNVWLGILLVLALVGINVFTYLAKGTDVMADLARMLGYTVVKTAQQTVDVAGEGTKAGINAVTGATDAASSALTAESVSHQPPPQAPPSSLHRALDHTSSMNSGGIDPAMASSTALGEPAYGSGYCFIGDEEGTRVCAKVGANDRCMSGQIFPSSEICVNPNLRP